MTGSDAETDADFARAAWLLDATDPSVLDDQVARTDDLLAITRMRTVREASDQALVAAVWAARARGRTWNQVAERLGVTRRAAAQWYERAGGHERSAG